MHSTIPCGLNAQETESIASHVARAVLTAHPELLDLARSPRCAASERPAPVPMPVSLMAPLEDYPDPPLDRTPLLRRLEAAFRPHRPSPQVFMDPMPPIAPEPSAGGDEAVVAAFRAGFRTIQVLLKGATEDGSLARLAAATGEPVPRAASGGVRRPRKNVSARIITMLSGDARRLEWSAKRWATELGCSKSSVVGSIAWKKLERLRATQRDEALERRARAAGAPHGEAG